MCSGVYHRLDDLSDHYRGSRPIDLRWSDGIRGAPAFLREPRRRAMADSTASTPRSPSILFILLLLLLRMNLTSCNDEACLRPANSIKYESPVTTAFTFLPPVKKTDDGLGMLYMAMEAVGTFLIPVPKIPTVALSEQVLRQPGVYLRRNAPSAMREYPRLTSAASLGLSLAIVFPVFGCCLLTCRCCCGACGGASNVEEGDHDRAWRCCCFFALGISCLVMTVAAGFGVVTNIYTYAGIADVLPYCNRSISDLVAGYLKTQHEVDTLLMKDYEIFETEMGQRLDSCVRVIGDDIESGLATSPLFLVKRLIDQVSRMKAAAEKTRTSAHDLADQVSKLAEKLTFPVATSNVAKVTDKCITLAPRPAQCEAVLNAKSLLNAQSGYLPQASGTLDAINRYAAVLTVTDAAFQVLQSGLQGSQVAASKEQFVQAAAAGVTAAKARLKDLGDDLADKANLVYIDSLEYPEDLVTRLDEHVGRRYRRAEKFIFAFVAGNLALVAVLLLVMFLYVGGLLIVAWGSEEGCCSFRAGRWCFSLGACCFVLLFGAAAAATTAGMTGAFLASRVACGLANNLASPALTEPLRFILSVVRGHVGNKELRSLASAVSAEYLTKVLARFGACGRDPTSAYNLVGETLARNASKALGLEKEAAFLWEGFDQKTINAQLENIGGPMDVTVDLNQTAELAKKLKTMLNHSLGLPTNPSEPDLKSQVSTINTNTDNADQLKAALIALKPIAAGANMATEVDQAEKEVDEMLLLFHSCTKAKNSAKKSRRALCPVSSRMEIALEKGMHGLNYHTAAKFNTLAKINVATTEAKLQTDLAELDTVLEVNGKPVDTFKMETIDLVENAGTSQEDFKKAAEKLNSRKQGLLDVVKGYTDFVIKEVKDTVGNCKQPYIMYRSAWEVGCKGVVYPFAGFWFSIATYLVVGIPAMFMALFMSTLYSRQPKPKEEEQPEEAKGTPPKPEEEDAAAGGDAGAKSPKKHSAAASLDESSDLKPKPKKAAGTAAKSSKKAFAAHESEETAEVKPKSKKAKSVKKAWAVAESEESVELKPQPKKSKDAATRGSKKVMAADESDESLELVPQAKKTKGKAGSSKKALAAVDSDELLDVKPRSKKTEERTPSVLSASSCSCIFTNTPTPEPERPENKIAVKDNGKKNNSPLSNEGRAKSLGDKQKNLAGMKARNAHDAEPKIDALLHGDHDGAGEKKGEKKPAKGLLMRAEVHHEGRKDVDKKRVKGRPGMAASDEEFTERRDWGGGERTKQEKHKARKSSGRQQEPAEEPDQRQSPNDLLALVYQGSRTGIGDFMRAMSQRALPSGSSVLGSITGSSRSLARNLFRRYRSTEDDSAEDSSSADFTLP